MNQTGKYLLLFLAGFLLALSLFHETSTPAPKCEALLMCFNETNGTWDRCRMKGEELHNTYEKAERLGVFCPDELAPVNP